MTSPERKAWVSKYGGQAATHAADPPPPPPPPLSLSMSLEWSTGKASTDIHGSSAVAGVARKLLYTASDCLRDSGSGFFLRVDSRSLSHEWVWPQGSGGLKSRVFLLLDELSSQTDEPHPPKALVFRRQVTHLQPFSYK